MSWAAGDERRALSRYLNEIRQFPLLEREDEQHLLQRIDRGDPEAASRLVEHNLSFVVKVATEYRSLGVPFEDLLNEGNLGLIEAAQRFDSSKGTKFITYAIWWIRKMILKAIADRSTVVRVPMHRRKKIYELKKAEAALLARLGRVPSREEIARHLSVSVAHVDSVSRLHLAHTSLDRSARKDDPAPLWEFLADDGASIEERLLSEEAGLHVANAFRRLSPREQAVLGWRLALEGPSSLTLKQVGQRLGLSRERVRQIENQAKHRLRRLLAESLRLSSRERRRHTGVGRGNSRRVAQFQSE
jgi:RNA polymerase primary sigma factor